MEADSPRIKRSFCGGSKLTGSLGIQFFYSENSKDT